MSVQLLPRWSPHRHALTMALLASAVALQPAHAQSDNWDEVVDQIEQLVPQRQSLMPDLLVRDLTAQEVADLLVYLDSLE